MAKTAADLKAEAAELAEKAAADAVRARELRDQAHKLEREERQAQRDQQKADNSRHLWESVGSNFYSKAVHDMVYGHAYSDASDYGLEMVEDRYEDYAEVARLAIEMSKQA